MTEPCCADTTGMPIGGHYPGCPNARAVPVGPQSNEVAAAYDAGVRDGYAAGRAVPVEGDRERLAALLRDVFPATQRDRWPFTAEDVADRIIAAGFRAGVSLTGESEA